MHGFDRNEAGKLFVGGLSWNTTKETLLEYFGQYGEVIDCVVMKNPETGKSRGFGFVTYRDLACVETVLAVAAHIVDGRQVDPKACNPKGNNRGGPGGGGSPPMGGEPHRMNRGPRGAGGPQGDRKIFLGGLPNGVDEEAIRDFFTQFGKVSDVTVMYDAQKQRSRGFGFLTFESDDAVNQVCREHFVNFNGKKVECKRATPRNQGNDNIEEMPPQQIHVSHPGGMPHIEIAVQQPQHGPGPLPGPEPQWTSPEVWSPQVQQSPPPPQMGVPPQFQQTTVQFQPGYQGDVPPNAPPGWPQQPPPQGAGGWPPGAPPGAPPQQPGGPQFMAQPAVTQSFPNAQPSPGAPVYQYAASSPAQQPPQPNGQAIQQVASLGQPAPSSYSYTATTYATPNVALPQTAATLSARPYQEFDGQQVQIATTMAPLQGAPAPVSAYPSPYGAPVPAGAPPTVAAADPYGQTALAHQPGAVQVGTQGVAPPPGGQPGVPAGYGSPLPQPPVASGSPDPSAPKAVEYSNYYSAYGYAVETAPGAAVSAPYGAQPAPAQAPAQAPFAGQDVPQAVAYGGAPGPSPTFQRQGSGQQFHPYARR